MTTTERARLFDEFTDTVFRLETRQTYLVAAEQERFAAWRAGRPLPERSILTSAWWRRMAVTSLEGKRWSRVRIVEYPLTQYTRFTLLSYADSAVIGQDVRITERDADPALAHLTEDFWLFDAETDHPAVVLMRYDDEGHFLNSAVSRDPEVVQRCRQQRDLALKYSVPLNQFLAEKAELIRA